MKALLLGHTDATLPQQRLTPEGKCSHLKPFPIKQGISPHDYLDKFDIIGNAKSVVLHVFRSIKDDSGSILGVSNIYTIYEFHDSSNEFKIVNKRRFYSSNKYCLNYCLSKCYRFVIVAEYGLGDKRGKMISIWNQPLLSLDNDNETVPFEYVPGNSSGDLVAEIGIGEDRDPICGCFLSFHQTAKFCVL